MAKHGYSGGGMPNMGNMMKQAQKMQADMMKMQEEMESKQIEATAGGGAVKAVVSGKKELLEIKISPEVISADDVEMLEDLVLTAVNDAMKQADALSQNEMSRITGGMNIPGLF